MTKQELKAKIDKLENGIKSKATPSNLIAPLKAQKAKLEKELQDMEASEKKAVKTKKVSKVAEKIKAAKKSVAKKTPAKAPAKEERKKDNIARDGDRKSLPAGKRISKTGKVYYETRVNRSDKQTSRKPYLAKGGMVKYFDNKEEWRLSRPSGSIEKEVLEKVKYYSSSDKDFVGNFGWRTASGKLAEGYLYRLDESDKDLVKDVKLKDGENIYRYFTRTTAVGGITPLIKVNLDKGLLYFSDTDDADKVTFETKGTSSEWVSLIKDKMEIGGFLLGAAVGSVATSLLSKKSSKNDKDKVEDTKELTWKEKFRENVNQEGFDSAVTEYSEDVKDKRFNDLKTDYLVKSKALKKYIGSKDIIDSEYDISVQDAIDSEGFDYALIGYNDWKGVEDNKFQTLYDDYKKSQKSLDKYVGDSKKYADGGEILVKVGDKVKRRRKKGAITSVTEGEVYEVLDGGYTFKLKDEFGNKSQKINYTRDFRKSEIKSMAKGGYVIFEGRDNYNDKPLYKVISKDEDNDYDGEFHDNREDAEKELNELKNKNMNYGYGGKTKNRKSTKDLTIEQMSSMTGVGKAGIEKFSDENNLSEEDLSNIMQGLGRRMISASDFATAVSGNKDNQYTKEIVDFAKSGKGYKMADGGKVDKLEYESILGVLKEKIDESIEELPSDYQTAAETFKGEEVEHESRDGFIAYTDGGYEARWFDNISNLNGSGISLPTMGLDAEMQRQVDYNYELAKDRFKDEYPEIVEELGEDNIDYNSLQDSGYDDEAEQLSEWEMNYDGDDTIMMEIGAFYYSPINYRASENKHTIFLFANVNLESPYHRSGNLEDGIDHTFTFDSLDELKEKMDENLKKIIDWFDGKNYKEGKKDLKITRMAKGGYMADGGMMDAVNTEVSTIRRNIMGTTSMVMKIKGMKKPQDFIVYPISADQAGKPITIQSDTRFGFLDLSSGRGLMSQSHPNGAYSYHFTADKKVPFKLSETDLQRIKEHISGTAGSSVGNMGISSDNSGASMMAKGGYMADGGFFDTKGDVKFKFSENEKIKVLQYDGGRLKKLGATIIEQYAAEQPDGTYYPFYWVVGDWESMEEGKKHPSLYAEDELIERHGNKPKKMADGGYMAKGGEVPAHFGSGRNIEVFGYQTENFDICGAAVKEFEAAVEIMQNAKESEKESLARCAKYVDGLFGIEKIVVENSSADDANFYEAVSDIMSASIYNYRAEMSINLFSFVPQHLKEIAVRMAKAEKGGFYALGGMTAGRWYRDKSGEEFKFIGKIDSGENKGKFLFTDGQKSVYKDLEDFEGGRPKETKLFGFFEDGGSVAEGNYEMLMSNIKAIKHHAEELEGAVTPNTEIEAWVLSKSERAETDLSDITHYLDGLKMEKGGYMAKGGNTNYTKTWKVVGRTMQGKLFEKEITLGRMSDRNDVMNALKRMPDTQIREITFIGERFKAASGGYMAKGGDLSSIKKKYEENEDENAHSENVVLLAKHFGTKEDLAKAKEILALHEKEGSLSSENGKKRQELHLKLIDKARAEMGKQGIEFEKGGYMADGGYVGETIAKVGESVVTKGGSGNYWAIVKSNGLIFIKKSFKTKEEAIKFLKESDKMADGGMMAKGGMTRKGGQPFEVEGRKFFYHKDDGNVYDSNHRLYAGSYSSLELAKKSLEKNFENIKTGNFYKDGGKVKFADKVKSVQESLLKRKKVSPKVQNDYGKTYSKAEAKESAQRIVGSRMAQLKEKMAKKKK